MKKIIPFKKDIAFNTNIGEVNSVSLEKYIETVNNNTVKGYFVIEGDYRLTESSVSLDPFEYKIPFDISVDKKYETDEMEIEIDNFYYEILNNKILSVNIDLSLDNLKEKKEEKKEEKRCIEKDEENTKIYKIYIVKENDTLEKIIEENGTTKEKISMYNNLENIKLGDKIIIPSE